MTRSQLDAIPGLGPAKQKGLLKTLGSVAKIKTASVQTLATAPGIGPAFAQRIYDHFHPDETDMEKAHGGIEEQPDSEAAESTEGTIVDEAAGAILDENDGMDTGEPDAVTAEQTGH